MFSRGWLPYAALAGCLASSALAQPIGNDTGAQTNAGERNAIPIERVNPTDLSPIQREIERIASAVEAIHASQESDDEKNRASSDLSAQQDMAHWASWMFWATAFQALLSLVGVGVILYTLKLSRRATKAAIDAVEVTRDTAKRQLRAYMGHRAAHFSSYGGLEQNGVVKYFDWNYGQTPALNVSMRVCISDARPEILDATNGDKQNLVQIVHPGQNLGCIIANNTKTRDDSFIVYGFTEYTDIFGQKWRHRFAFSHSPQNQFSHWSEEWVADGTHNDEQRWDEKTSQWVSVG